MRAQLLKPSVVVKHVCQPIFKFVVNMMSTNQKKRGQCFRRKSLSSRLFLIKQQAEPYKVVQKSPAQKGTFFPTLGSNGCAANMGQPHLKSTCLIKQRSCSTKKFGSQEQQRGTDPSVNLCKEKECSERFTCPLQLSIHFFTSDFTWRRRIQGYIIY